MPMPLWSVARGLYQSKKARQLRPRASFERAEALGKVRAILQGLELRLGEGIVVGDARPRVGLRDTEVSIEQGQRLRRHRRAAVGVDAQLPGLDVLPLARF